MDNLMAPIYIHSEGPLGLGILPEMNIALPGIFWIIILPVLIIVGLILGIRYWKATIPAGIKKLKLKQIMMKKKDMINILKINIRL